MQRVQKQEVRNQEATPIIPGGKDEKIDPPS
jgi:hypothetical protein